ncbi:MAG TPA: hypothetical protein VF195_09340 [Actinomycetota bacterium]
MNEPVAVVGGPVAAAGVERTTKTSGMALKSANTARRAFIAASLSTEPPTPMRASGLSKTGGSLYRIGLNHSNDDDLAIDFVTILIFSSHFVASAARESD